MKGAQCTTTPPSIRTTAPSRASARASSTTSPTSAATLSASPSTEALPRRAHSASTGELAQGLRSGGDCRRSCTCGRRTAWSPFSACRTRIPVRWPYRGRRTRLGGRPGAGAGHPPARDGGAARRLPAEGERAHAPLCMGTLVSASHRSPPPWPAHCRGTHSSLGDALNVAPAQFAALAVEDPPRQRLAALLEVDLGPDVPAVAGVVDQAQHVQGLVDPPSVAARRESPWRRRSCWTLQTVRAVGEVAAFGGARGAAGGLAIGACGGLLFAQQLQQVGAGGEQPVVTGQVRRLFFHTAFEQPERLCSVKDQPVSLFVRPPARR